MIVSTELIRKFRQTSNSLPKFENVIYERVPITLIGLKSKKRQAQWYDWKCYQWDLTHGVSVGVP
jgi:hypothetical protein